jgi:hypothetical protein
MAGNPFLDCECFKRMCRHYSGDSQKSGKDEFLHTCNAFPEGIPPEICRGKNPHSSPVSGQANGIVFEKSPSYGEMEMFKSKRGAK